MTEERTAYGAREVVVELDIGGGWRRVRSQSEIEPPGSLSSDEPDGRQVYLFGWHDGDGPAVWRSEGGVDAANDAVRMVVATGLVKVADLDAEQDHRMAFWRGGQSTPLRFRVEAGDR